MTKDYSDTSIISSIFKFFIPFGIGIIILLLFILLIYALYGGYSKLNNDTIIPFYDSNFTCKFYGKRSGTIIFILKNDSYSSSNSTIKLYYTLIDNEGITSNHICFYNDIVLPNSSIIISDSINIENSQKIILYDLKYSLDKEEYKF